MWMQQSSVDLRPATRVVQLDDKDREDPAGVSRSEPLQVEPDLSALSW